jgi:RNA-directed DNA polymerase
MHGSNRANGPAERSEWDSINWSKTDRVVQNLRQRIFRATSEGDLRKVRSLQKLMLRSYSNAVQSIRKVTQHNQGKNTPGVDRVVVKTSTAKVNMAKTLLGQQPERVQPARRLYIPKANGKLRPLGIPTVHDRCLQAMVKNALEPEWEKTFESTSYGFRPGRSCHDAMHKVYLLARANNRKKWVVDADIKGAFDNISHEYLLKAIQRFSARELIKGWLKAGYIDVGQLHATEAGTPQGSVISPLLANIALHGMEQALGVKRDPKGVYRCSRAVVRYADDFLVFCESREDAIECVKILKRFLDDRGLEFSAEKTRIVHLREGFDFLGFHVRQFKYRNAKTGWKLVIQPSKSSVQSLKEKLRLIWEQGRHLPLSVMISRLNAVIRGWGNYHRKRQAWRTFNKMDTWMFHRAVRFVKRRHGNRTWSWIHPRYWGQLHPGRKDRWVFGILPEGPYIQKFCWMTSQRYKMVKGTASPDDPKLRTYWLERSDPRYRTRCLLAQLSLPPIGSTSEHESGQ